MREIQIETLWMSGGKREKAKMTAIKEGQGSSWSPRRHPEHNHYIVFIRGVEGFMCHYEEPSHPSAGRGQERHVHGNLRKCHSADTVTGGGGCLTGLWLQQWIRVLWRLLAVLMWCRPPGERTLLGEIVQMKSERLIRLTRWHVTPPPPLPEYLAEDDVVVPSLPGEKKLLILDLLPSWRRRKILPM